MLATLGIWFAAATGCWFAATEIAQRIEAAILQDSRAALAQAGQDWAQPRADGLRLHLSGSAPDEVARFRALAAAGEVVPASRIVDGTTLVSRPMLEVPDFAAELMRRPDGITILGLLPRRSDAPALAQRLREATGENVAEMSTQAAFPPPPGWTEAFGFAEAAVARMEEATISVRSGAVVVKANAASADEATALEAELQSMLPAGVALTLDIAAPLPVIAPYRLAAERTGDRLALQECAAPDAEARAAILEAVAQAGGAPDEDNCSLGLGAPDGNWPEAVARSLAALQALGAGQLTVAGRDITLEAAPATPAPALEEARRLLADLPASYAATVTLAPEPPPDLGPPSFAVSMTLEGPAVLEGRVPGDELAEVVETLARSRLGPVRSELVVDPLLGDAWVARVLAGIEAMGALDHGTLAVDAERIALSGASGDRVAAERAVEALAARLGPGAAYRLQIAYDPLRDPLIQRPAGDTCVDRMNAIMLQSVIGFEPGGARIAGDIAPLLRQLEPVVAQCADYRIEIAGHTDAVGGDQSNLTLSRRRAEAVLAAMDEAGLQVGQMTARGYGETRPIAENDTEEGREANRRIEFTLLSVEAVSAPPQQAEVIEGVTPGPEEAMERLEAAQSAREAEARRAQASRAALERRIDEEIEAGAADPTDYTQDLTDPVPPGSDPLGHRPRHRPDDLDATADTDTDTDADADAGQEVGTADADNGDQP